MQLYPCIHFCLLTNTSLACSPAHARPVLLQTHRIGVHSSPAGALFLWCVSAGLRERERERGERGKRGEENKQVREEKDSQQREKEGLVKEERQESHEEHEEPEEHKHEEHEEHEETEGSDEEFNV